MSDSGEESDYEYDSYESGNEDDVTQTQTQTQSNVDMEVSKDEQYRVLSYEEVTPIMKQLIAEVSNLLDVTEAVTEVLLRNFKWNKELLFNEYCSAEDTFWSKAGVTRITKANAASPPSKAMSTRKKRKETFYCGICCDNEVLLADRFGLDCHHYFCKECFEGYLNNGINDGPACVRLTCPEHQCNQAVSSSIVQALCSSTVAANYSMYLTRNFIETSSTMRWCPSPGCTKVALISAHADSTTNITCTGPDCATEFCFRCGHNAHTPLSCELMEQWQLKLSSESENYLWVVTNTKKCPKCKNRIEKNGGCMHMTCKMCRHGFCWHCMQPWEARGHTWNHANCQPHLAEENSKKNEQNVQNVHDLERYIKYFSRYDSHDKSIKFAGKQLEAAMARMTVMMDEARDRGGGEGGGGGYIDVEYLLRAVEQVIEGRKALKFAYAFAYFLVDGNPQKALFEDSLEVLERHIEALSQLTEGKEGEKGGEKKRRGVAKSSSQSSVAISAVPLNSTDIKLNMPAITAHLTAVFSKHAPERVASIPATLEKYKGREQGLVTEIERIYNEPAPAGLFGGAGEGATGCDELVEEELKEEKGGEGMKIDRLKCINLTSAIKKSLVSLLDVRNELHFQFRSSQSSTLPSL